MAEEGQRNSMAGRDGRAVMKQAPGSNIRTADDLRGFYSYCTGEVTVAPEASGYSTWFVELTEGLGHRALIGDAS